MIEPFRGAWRRLDSLTVVLLARFLPMGDENPRNRFFVYFGMVFILTLCTFSVLNLLSMRLFRSLAAALAATGHIVGLLVLRNRANPRIAFRISAVTMICYFLFLVSLEGPGGARIFWLLVFPVYAFLLFGGREGLIWTTAGFIGFVCVLLDPNDVLAIFSAENSRFLLSYGILGVLAFAFDRVAYQAQEDMVRERTDELEEAIQRLFTQIEERQRAEAALLLSEERFRTLSEASFEGIALTDVGLFVDLNDQLARMLGYERSELIGKPVVRCVAPEHRELVQTAIRSGEKGPYEHLALRKDGSVFPVETQAGTGTVGGRMIRTTALRDISDRKKAEAEIREAKEYAEAILDSLPGTFYVFDEQLRLIRWNKNFETVSGCAPEELPGIHPLELIDEKDRDTVARMLEESATTSQNVCVEANALTQGGNVIPYLFTAAWRTLGGRQYLLGSGVDISDLKKAEERLRRSEELFRKVFEIAPDAVSISELERGVFVDVNQSFSDLMGYSRDELIGKSAVDLNIWAQDHVREKMIHNLARKGVVRNVEATFRCKDGTLKHGLLSASTIVLDGETHLLAIVKDIAELKNAEAERLRLERQVRHAQKLESLGVLAGGIAHDFNNILTGILGNADLALMRISALAPERGNLEEIRKAALRAAGLANQMLAYSGKGKFELRSIDLSSLVKEMAQLLDVSISKKALLVYDLADGLPLVEGDVNQIRQVVMNLITNASESLDQESGVIRLSTSSAFCDRVYLDAISEGQSDSEESLPEGVYVSLEVTDTGCGMDLETQSKVFDPFFTTKFFGRGLGMAAALGIVRGHKGVIRIYSEIGKGTTFKVLFPAAKDLGASQTRDVGDEDAHQFMQGGLILVADDEAMVCNVAKEMLEEIGLTVLTASDGNQAVEVYRENVGKISFVLLDLTMPGLDGEQVFQEMKRLNPGVKVILSSGYNEQDVTHRFVGKGLAGFIQKPYTMAKLREKLKEVFRTI